MAYYIYQINQAAGSMVKNLNLLKQYDAFQQAKSEVRNMREAMSAEDRFELKIIFAESELRAEELLQEKRETPVVMEWEK
ncbi:MAG: hypothetical protein IIB69_12360 [Proteobacteria bacterium]|nr:hypothetical protein [Pseudomonadota bacterium]